MKAPLDQKSRFRKKVVEREGQPTDDHKERSSHREGLSSRGEATEMAVATASHKHSELWWRTVCSYYVSRLDRHVTYYTSHMLYM
jgi:hypothetical protein